MKWFLSGGSNKGEHRKEPKPATNDVEGKDDRFLALDGCLMIFGGSAAYDSKRHQKVACRETYTAQPATPPFLQWSESAITFDRPDQPTAPPGSDVMELEEDPAT